MFEIVTDIAPLEIENVPFYTFSLPSGKRPLCGQL
jgi:hypothetical protein